MLKKLPDNPVDLVVTSPPYTDQRKGTYGGIHHDKYVEWFLPNYGVLRLASHIAQHRRVGLFAASPAQSQHTNSFTGLFASIPNAAKQAA